MKAIQGFNVCLDGTEGAGLSVRNDPLVCQANNDTWVVEILPTESERITIEDLTKDDVIRKLKEIEFQCRSMLGLLSNYDEPS